MHISLLEKGIGKEAARQLSSMGASVVLACRDLDKAETVAAELRKKSTSPIKVEAQVLDLASLESISAFVSKFEGRPVHVLVNNAGAMFATGPDHLDSFGGSERTFAVNHLGPFALTMGLLPSLVLGGGENSNSSGGRSRVVMVSSKLEKGGSIEFNHPSSFQDDENFSTFRAYSTSKLANIIFAKELEKRYVSPLLKRTYLS